MISCPVNIVNSLKRTDRNIFFALYQASLEFEKVKIGQETLATFANVLRQAGHKSVHRLANLGLVRMQRPKNHRYTSLTYTLPRQILTPHAQFLLQPTFARYGLTRTHWFCFFKELKLSRILKKFQAEKRTANSLSLYNITLPLHSYITLETLSYNRHSHNKSENTPHDNQKQTLMSTTQKHRGKMLTATQKAMILEKLRNKENVEWVLPHVKGVNVLTLTTYGQAMLCSFDEEAIFYAQNTFKPSKSITNPFGLFVGICKRYSSEHGLKVDWKYGFNLVEALGLPKDSPTHTGVPSLNRNVTNVKCNDNGEGKGSTISFEEASRRNNETMVRHMGSQEAVDAWSKQYDEARPMSDYERVTGNKESQVSEQKATCWTEPLENIVKNLAILRQLAQEGPQFQRDTAQQALCTLEKVVTERINKQDYVKTQSLKGTPSPTGLMPNGMDNEKSQTSLAFSNPLPNVHVTTPPAPPSHAAEAQDFLNTDLFEELYD
jgi:hypothetical protein